MFVPAGVSCSLFSILYCIMKPTSDNRCGEQTSTLTNSARAMGGANAGIIGAHVTGAARDMLDDGEGR